MKDNSSLLLRNTMFPLILLLFVATSHTKPIDYEDVVDLLPTEPQTTNETLATIVKDPVVQDAVQDTVGNGSLEGLVVKKTVFIIPATEPTKVVSQREQLLIVPTDNLEEVKKNITESENTENDVNDWASTDTQSFTDSKNGYEDENISTYISRHTDSYETSTEISKVAQKSAFLIDNTPQKVPHFLPNASQEEEMALAEHPSPMISVPIIAFLDPAKSSNDKIDIPIAAALPIRDNTVKSQLNLLEDKREIYGNPWNIDINNWRFSATPSEIQTSSALYEPTTIETQGANSIPSENLLPVIIPRIDIVKPLFWTSDTGVNYVKDPHDMDVAADIVFRPLFRFRQEAQRKSWRRGPDNYRRSVYQGYNSYNSYPRRNYGYNYGYRPRYSDDDYY